MKTILIVDYQLSSCETIKNFLTKNNYTVITTYRGDKALRLIQENDFDLILCDYRLPDIDGTEFYDRLLISKPASKIIFMSKEVNLKNIVKLIRKGAYNYLEKPLNPDELLQVVQDALNSSNKELQNRKNVKQENNRDHLPDNFVVGQSKESVYMLKLVQKVAPTNFTVIIEGETGTGKESIARMVHNMSKRKSHPFIAVDCGSISNELSGSELFGHEKGSFTGAISGKTGFFELAQGGTIFLDEIANLSLDTQMALLRALQEKVIRKVGGTKEIPIDVRVIAATNENLLHKSETVGFRNDLFFRLSEFILKVPALRNRKNDLSLFIDHFLQTTSQELNQAKPKLSNEVLELLYEYKWPGNIRELKNTIRRACLFVSKDNYIYSDALPSNLINKEFDFEEEKETIIPEEAADLKSTAFKAEAQKIIEVLRKTKFNKTKAAEVLNIHRKTLYTKLKLMNIEY